MPKPNEPKEVIEGEVLEVFALEKSVADMEQELMANEQFRAFLQTQKEAKEKIGATWQRIEEQMLANDIKSIKGDWGSLTITERLGWDYDPSLLPKKFFKVVVDEKKLSDTFRLEGKPPKAAFPKYTKYLVKRIK